MTLISILFDLFNLGTTFPAVTEKTFNNISYKFFFDLNLFGEQPFLILRVRKAGEREFLFENKLNVGVTQTIDQSLKIFPVFIKILYQERWIEDYNRVSDPDQPNQILYLTKVRDLV